jgi:hypothetical protein
MVRVAPPHSVERAKSLGSRVADGKSNATTCRPERPGSSADADDRCDSGCRHTLAKLQFFTMEMQKEALMIKIVGLLLVAAIATYGLHAFAQIRADVRPSMTPIGSSSSNGVSFAWFYDSTERTVVVCRIGQAPGDSVDCKARTTLQ